jgi:hypothetical protein
LRVLAEYTYHRLLDMPAFPEEQQAQEAEKLEQPSADEEQEPAALPAQATATTEGKQIQ